MLTRPIPANATGLVCTSQHSLVLSMCHSSVLANTSDFADTEHAIIFVVQYYHILLQYAVALPVYLYICMYMCV